LATDITIRPISAVTATGDAATATATALAGHARKVPDASQKFEAFVLQTFIQEMMPETPEGVYGSGIAGDFWKSMMAEKIAEQVAERGSVGIANYISGAHPSALKPGVANASADVLSHLTTMGGSAASLDPKSGSGE
jgi:Rod binding domain-containing protein